MARQANAGEPAGEADVQVTEFGPPGRVRVYAFEERRETAATWLAYGLLGIFVLTILLPLVYWLVYAEPSAAMLTYVKDSLTVETTLLGVTFGFYFSQRRLGGGGQG
jgi:hypothetical protein